MHKGNNATEAGIREYIARLELQASSNLPIRKEELQVPIGALPPALRWYVEESKDLLGINLLEKANYSSTLGGLLREVRSKISDFQYINSEFELRTIEQGKPLVIFFQGFASIMPEYSLSLPWLRPMFSANKLGERLSETCAVSRLHVRDSLQLWYLAGPLGGIEPREGFHKLAGLDAWCAHLHSYISQCAPSRVITCGTSAGGTAALVLGNLIGADRIISIAPQGRFFDLEWEKQLPFSQYTNICRWRFAAAKELGIPAPLSIIDLLGKNKSKTTVIVPRYNAGDCAALAHIPQDDLLQIQYMENHQHGKVDKNYLFMKLYNEIVS